VSNPCTRRSPFAAFGGVRFRRVSLTLSNDFLNVLPLAIEELRLPAMEVTQLDDWRFSLTCAGPYGFG